MENVYSLLNNLKQQHLVIAFKCECYHFETKTRDIPIGTDANGNPQTKTITYEEKVVTWRNSTIYQYKHWSDRSPSYDGLDEYEVTKLNVHKQIIFANDQTRIDYEQKLMQFKNENHKDEHQDYSNDVQIAGYKNKCLTSLHENTIPEWLNLPTFFLVSFVFLSPVFRMYMTSKVGRKDYNLIKQISI